MNSLIYAVLKLPTLNIYLNIRLRISYLPNMFHFSKLSIDDLTDSATIKNIEMITANQ